MNALLDAVMPTVVWLTHFPATHGYAMVFVASFGLIGLVARSVTNPASSSRLRALQAEAGEQPTAGQVLRSTAGHVQMVVYHVIALVVLVGGVIGVVSLVKGPVTASYVADHGIDATGTYDDAAVTFRATDGTTYVLPYDFFTPASTEGHDGFLSSGDQVTVTYLESHPQAYVVRAAQEDDDS